MNLTKFLKLVDEEIKKMTVEETENFCMNMRGLYRKIKERNLYILIRTMFCK